MPLVSIIIAIYNARPYLAEMVASIHSQTETKLEIIGIDDGSTDGSAEEFARLAPEAILLRQENLGPSAARNAGLAIARGDYVAFLDADDIWPEGKLAHQVERMESDRESQMSTGHVATFSEVTQPDGQIVRQWTAPFFQLLFGSTLFRRELFERIGGFDAQKFPFFGEDHDWFMRAWERQEPIEITPLTTLFYRRRLDSLTGNRSLIPRTVMTMLKASLDRRRAGGSAIKLRPNCFRYHHPTSALLPT